MKVGIFVDVGNLYYCVGKAFPGRKLDYQKYLDSVIDRLGSEITTINAYGTQLDREAVTFIAALRHIGYEPKWKRERQDGRRVSWNVGIAVDALRSDANAIVIGSSDSNIAELVSSLITEGINTIVMASRISRELKETGAMIVEIDESLLEEKNA